MFGLCDGLAPLLGILIGHYWGEKIGETGEVSWGRSGWVSTACTSSSGRGEPRHQEEMDRPWAVYGLIVPLSADNIVAGTSLGLLGASTWLAPLVFGVSTFLMALLGLYLGRAASCLHSHPSRSPDRRGTRRHGHRDGDVPG